MGNKKLRRRAKLRNETVGYELPPTPTSTSSKSRKKKTPSTNATDDTPKSFLRLMTLKRPRGGDEDTGLSGAPSGKKRKQEHSTGRDLEKEVQLKILPNESLKQFSRRVDATMQVPGLGRTEIPHRRHLKKGKVQVEEMDPVKLNTKEIRRGELERRKGKGRGEGKEEQEKEKEWKWEDSESDYDSEGNPLPGVRKYSGGVGRRKPGKYGKKKKRDVSPDPWAKVGGVKPTIRFGEVAPEPPKLKVVPREILKNKVPVREEEEVEWEFGGGKGKEKRGDGLKGKYTGVPKASGSLVRREALGEEREGIVARYRELMSGKRSGVALTT